jgi:hypothetical protein
MRPAAALRYTLIKGQSVAVVDAAGERFGFPSLNQGGVASERKNRPTCFSPFFYAVGQKCLVAHQKRSHID